MTAGGCNPGGGERNNETTAIPNGDSLPAVIPVKINIRFPAAGERLEKGKTYTLQWDGGDDTVSIFLIDSALEKKGASVSISDRIYGIENTGSYNYTVPERLEEGTYKFTIGAGSSPYFRIFAP